MTDSCRIASTDDLDTLVELAREFHTLSPFKDYRFSPSGSRRHFIAMMESPNTVIIMHDNGLIGGTVSDYPFCEMRVAKEAFWFARREGLGGMVLLDHYVKWVARQGADIDLISSLEIAGLRPGLMARLLRRRGYSDVETTHMRVV